jgi:hypothetical protein
MRGDAAPHRRTILQALAGLVATAFCFRRRDSQAAEEPKIDLATLPAKVREAADRRAPGVKWSQASPSEEDGHVLYELQGKDANGRKVTIEVTGEGKVTSLQAEIALGELPAAARKAADRNFAQAKWSVVRKSEENGQVLYDLEGKGAKGREISLEVTAEGKVTKIEAEIAVNEVPATVREAAQKAAPRAKWSEASKHQDGDDVSYVLDGEIGKGLAISAEITAEGKVIEIEKEIPLKQVPKAVSAALKAKMPKFKASAVFEISKEGKVVSYEFEGKRPRDKEEIAVSVSADGKTVEIVEDK